MKKIAVVLLNYNSSAETIACVSSLLISKVDDMTVDIIVVDNDSESKEKTLLLNNLPKIKHPFTITLIQNKENTGFSGGNNTGIKQALKEHADGIIILNNDTLVSKDLISQLVHGADTHLHAGVIVPKIYFAKGYEFHKERYTNEEKGKVIWYAGGKIDWQNVLGEHLGVDEVDHGQYDDVRKVSFASGCCLFIKPEVIRKVGMFDEKYFLYFEDADFSMRLKKTGYDILYYPKAYLWHKNGGSTGGSGSSLQDYYMTRNRLLFGMTYAPVRAKVALLRMGWRLLQTGREWERKGARDFFKKRLGKGSFTTV